MTSEEYELFAKAIYEELLKETGITVEVKHNQKIQGNATKHQIDVYWEYLKDGKLRRTAIECKNYNSKKNAVSTGRIRDFYGMLADIGNIDGIIVAKRKYQAGAEKFARYYGINLMTLYKPFQIQEIFVQSCYPVPKNITYTIGEGMYLERVATTEAELHSILLQNGIWEFLEVCKLDGTNSKSIVQMIRTLPQNNKAEQDLSHEIKFEDEYLFIKGIGMVKLMRLKFQYDVRVRKTDLMHDAKKIEISILKNVHEGKMLHFDSSGKLIKKL